MFVCMCTPAHRLERHGLWEPCWVIDNRLGSFMMELSALLCRFLLAVALLTFSETHQNATSLSSFLNWVLSGKIPPTGSLLSFSGLSRQKIWYGDLNTGIVFTRALWWSVLLSEAFQRNAERKLFLLRREIRILWPSAANTHYLDVCIGCFKAFWNAFSNFSNTLKLSSNVIKCQHRRVESNKPEEHLHFQAFSFILKPPLAAGRGIRKHQPTNTRCARW